MATKLDALLAGVPLDLQRQIKKEVAAMHYAREARIAELTKHLNRILAAQDALDMGGSWDALDENESAHLTAKRYLNPLPAAMNQGGGDIMTNQDNGNRRS